MELDDLKQELQSYKDSRDKAIKNGEDFAWINDIIVGLEQDIERLSKQEMGTQSTEEPAAEIARPVFVLPTNYNLIFGDTRANQEITNLIAQVEKQLIAEHKAELETIFETHRQKLAELQSIIDIGVPENARLTELVGTLQSQVSTIAAEKKEAELKRDNAVALKEEAETTLRRVEQEKSSLSEQIRELEGMLQVYRKKPEAPTGITLTTTLKPETEDEKAVRMEKARVEQINKNLQKYDIAPLPTKDEIVTSTQLDDSFRSMAASEAVVSDEPGGVGVSQAAASVEQAEDGASKLTIEQIAADVTGLKEQMRIVFDRLDLH